MAALDLQNWTTTKNLCGWKVLLSSIIFFTTVIQMRKITAENYNLEIYLFYEVKMHW